MKFYRCILCFLFLSMNLWARTYKVDDRSLNLDDGTSFVCDPGNVISPDSVTVINKLVSELEDSLSIEIRVVVVDSVAGGDCFQFSVDLFNKYGIGSEKLDNGLLIMLSTGNRRVQFVTGYGLEGDLPDVNCVRLQRLYMNNYFGNNEWSAGLTAGVRAVCDYLSGNIDVIANDEEEDSVFGDVFIYVLLFLLVFRPGWLFYYPFILAINIVIWLFHIMGWLLDVKMESMDWRWGSWIDLLKSKTEGGSSGSSGGDSSGSEYSGGGSSGGGGGGSSF